MNTPEKWMSDMPSNESHLSDKNSVSSLNIPGNPSLIETTAIVKKDLGYIFKLDATKKKLESINKKIEKFYNKSLDLTALIAEKNRVSLILEKSYYETDIKYQELFNMFNQNLGIHWFENVNPVINQIERDAYLKTFTNDEDRQNMTVILNNLYISFLDAGVQKAILDSLSQNMTTLQKEVADASKQLNDNKKLMDQEIKHFDEVNKEWLLKSYEMSSTKTSIDDLIAHPQIETQLRKLITMYTNKNEMAKFWLTLPKGILFIGEPDTGKTFAAKVLASEIDRKVYHIKAHDLFSEDVNDPNEMLYTIFYNVIEHAQKTKIPCIIFLDEIENIISSVWEYNPASEKMISNTIIKNITNIQKSGLDIIVLAALSHRNKLDERFLKYNLFDNQFFFELPESQERKRFFTMNIQKAEKRAKLKLFSPEITSEMLDELVKKTEGFSAEYIKQLINACVKEYSYNYLQTNSSFSIEKEFIADSLKKISLQKNTSSKSLSPKERKKVISPLVSKYTMKNLLFGQLFNHKKEELIQYIVENTEWYTEDNLKTVIQLCVEEYKHRKSNYHKKNLIQKDFILAKINELKSEDRSKGKRAYFHNL